MVIVGCDNLAVTQNLAILYNHWNLAGSKGVGWLYGNLYLLSISKVLKILQVLPLFEHHGKRHMQTSGARTAISWKSQRFLRLSALRILSFAYNISDLPFLKYFQNLNFWKCLEKLGAGACSGTFARKLKDLKDFWKFERFERFERFQMVSNVFECLQRFQVLRKHLKILRIFQIFQIFGFRANWGRDPPLPFKNVQNSHFLKRFEYIWKDLRKYLKPQAHRIDPLSCKDLKIVKCFQYLRFSKRIETIWKIRKIWKHLTTFQIFQIFQIFRISGQRHRDPRLSFQKLSKNHNFWKNIW